MPRPCCRRQISGKLRCASFRPEGGAESAGEEVVLALDELEALRLVDLLGHYQEEAAGEMRVSRQTLGRILEKARRTTADALVNGKTLRIGGGSVEIRPGGGAGCPRCRRKANPAGRNGPGCRLCGGNPAADPEGGRRGPGGEEEG